MSRGVSGVYDDAQGEQSNAKNSRSDSRPKTGRGISLDSVAEVLERYGIEPIDAIVTALQSDQLAAKEKAMISLELLQYTRPKLKAVEHKGEIKMTGEQLHGRLRYLMEKAGLADGAGSGQADGS